MHLRKLVLILTENTLKVKFISNLS